MSHQNRSSSHRIRPRASRDQHQATTSSEVLSSVLSRARWGGAAFCGVGWSLLVALPPHAARTGHRQLPTCPSPDPLRCRLPCHDRGYFASAVCQQHGCGITIGSLLQHGFCRVPKLGVALRCTRIVTLFLCVSCSCTPLINSVAIEGVRARQQRRQHRGVDLCFFVSDRIVLWLCMPRRACHALTSDGFIGYRGPRPARKHRDGNLASLSHVSLNAVCFCGIPGVISPQACVSLPQTWLAQPPSSCAAGTQMRRHACACCITTA